MNRKLLKGVVEISLVILIVTICLISNASYILDNSIFDDIIFWLGVILDSNETQWVVFLCLGIYFGVFIFLRLRVNRNSPKRLTFKLRRLTPCALWWSSVILGAHEVTRPIFWLTSGLFISAVAYIINYSPSTQALTLLGGAVLGQGVTAWAVFNKTKLFPLLFLSMLVILLSLTSVWNVDLRYIYGYHSHARWSGPWDNPNIYGLLMAVGISLAVGLLLQSLMSKVKGKETGAKRWKLEVGKCVVAILCLLAAILMGRGLLHSYSRGAWIATICGLAYLIANSEVKGSLSGSCSSCISRFKNNWLPSCVLLFSLAILFFWQFRQTDWHPARRALSAINPVDFSWRNRIAAWEGALQITAEHPCFGAGWNKPEPLYEHYYTPSKLSESGAIEMNDYLMIGATLGIPALFCFGMYLWLSLTRKSEIGNRKSEITDIDWLNATCRAGAIVLLVGFWFDGGLFKLATASTFWILLELGRADLVQQKATEETKVDPILA